MSIPSTLEGLDVHCRTPGVRLHDGIKTKACQDGNCEVEGQSAMCWHTSAADTPSSMWIFTWKNITINAYRDNNHVRLSFDQQRQGWVLTKGYYRIFVWLLDENFTVLQKVLMFDTSGQESYKPPGGDQPDWAPYTCEGEFAHGWFDNIKHMAFSLEANGVGFSPP